MKEVISNSCSGHDELCFLDLAIALGKEKRILLGMPLLFVICAILYTQIFRSVPAPTYTASAAVEVQERPGKQINFLLSRSTQIYLVDQLQLQQIFATTNSLETCTMLANATKIKLDKAPNTIIIEVKNKDILVANKLLNGYLQILRDHLNRDKPSEFYAGLINRLKDHPDDIRNVSFLARSRLLQHVRQRETEYFSFLSQGAFPNDPVLQRRIQELHLFTTQLDVLNSVNPGGMGSTIQSDWPQKVATVLACQYELAKLDEALAPPSLKIIEQGSFVQKNYGIIPPSMVVMLAGSIGIFLGFFWALLRSGLRTTMEEPKFVSRMNELKRVWAIGSRKGDSSEKTIAV